jgi:hypothetical protein
MKEWALILWCVPVMCNRTKTYGVRRLFSNEASGLEVLSVFSEEATLTDPPIIVIIF